VDVCLIVCVSVCVCVSLYVCVSHCVWMSLSPSKVQLYSTENYIQYPITNNEKEKN